MPGIRIPGAESIDPIAPGRDPGVQATPDQFGAGIAEAGQRNAQAVEQLGVSENHIADALGSLGAHLERKRQDAEDQVYVQTHAVDSAVRIQAAQLKARQDFPDGGPGYMEALNTGIQRANDSVTADLGARGLRPSQRASARVATQFAGIQSNALVNGVTYDNNAQVAKLQDASSDNVKATASQVGAGTLPLDDGLKQIDDIVKSGKGIYSGAALRTFEENSQKAVVNGEIERLTRTGLLEQATALRDKWYGHIAIKGEGNAGAVAAAAEQLGIAPRDLAAVISYETGGKMDPSQWGGKGNNYLGLIQFGPEERAKYGVTPGMTFAEQMPAVVNFLKDRGLKPGMDVAQLYSIINAGSLTPNGQPRYSASDGNGTIAEHVARITRDHLPAADRFLTGVPSKGEADGGQLPDPTLALHWQKEFEAQRTDMVRADALTKIQQQKASDAAENETQKALSEINETGVENPNYTVRTISNDDRMNLPAKARMRILAEKVLKDDPIAKVSQATTMQLIADIRRPEGDPQRMTSVDPIYQKLQEGKLSRADFDFVKKQFTEQTGPDGSDLNKMRTSFLKNAGDAITIANLGSSIQGGAGTFQKYNFERYVAKAEADYLAASKNPANLFTPGHPDYLGKLDKTGRPAVLLPFLKDLQTSTREEAATIKPTPKEDSSPAKRAALDEWIRQRGLPALPAAVTATAPASE